MAGSVVIAIRRNLKGPMWDLTVRVAVIE